MLTVVTGPPCSGKTTYIRQRAVAGDIVIDLDAIARTLGSPDTHDHPPTILAVAAAARHGAITEAIRQHHRRGVTVWIVDASPSTTRQVQYDRAGATIVRLSADRAELHRRATASSRGQATHRRIDAWSEAMPGQGEAGSRPW